MTRRDRSLLALTGLGAVLLGLTLAGLALHAPGTTTLPSLGVTWVFVGLMALAAVAYFAAVALVLRRPMPLGAVWIVLGMALALRACLLPAPPFLSSDVFRYVWDGKVQNAGFDPYRYVPDDAALARLRDRTIFPHINRADYARTIYPPFAQLVFRAVAAISPTVIAMKTAMVGCEIVAVLAVLRVLALADLPRERVLIYAWNPLAVWAFAGNGHVDAIAIGLIGLALLARLGRRNGFTGVLLGCAFLVKFLPIALAPALWRRRDWRLPAAAAATIAVLYACYSGAGRHVLGFLPHYVAEEGFARGSGIWLLSGLGDLIPLPPAASIAYVLVVACALTALAVWVVRQDHEDIAMIAGNAAFLAAATVVAVSPHYAWYFAWLALPCCIRPLKSVIFLSAAGLLLYVNPLNEHFLWPSLLFIPAAGLALRDLRPLRPAEQDALSWLQR
jgi:alpha-1,6-mannosyltransferase